MKNTILFALAASILLATSSLGLSHEYKIGDLEIDHPHARATLPGAPVSGGYMIIRNSGNEADRLISATVDFAGKTEIHEMAVEGDIMKMRQLPDGIEVPAGGTVVLKPGGFHLMFMGLSEPLNEGEKHKAVLVFEKAGRIEVEFEVEVIKPNASMDHSGHSSN